MEYHLLSEVGTISFTLSGPPNCSTVLAADTRYFGTSKLNFPTIHASTTNA